MQNMAKDNQHMAQDVRIYVRRLIQACREHPYFRMIQDDCEHACLQMVQACCEHAYSRMVQACCEHAYFLLDMGPNWAQAGPGTKLGPNWFQTAPGHIGNVI